MSLCSRLSVFACVLAFAKESNSQSNSDLFGPIRDAVAAADATGADAIVADLKSLLENCEATAKAKRQEASVAKTAKITLDRLALTNRSKLLLKHYPKSGGTYLEAVLSEAVSKEQSRKEFELVTAQDRASRFVIGEIREPCSYYVSLFAFGSSRPHSGDFARKEYKALGSKEAAKIYGTKPPHISPRGRSQTVAAAPRMPRGYSARDAAAGCRAAPGALFRSSFF
mmetsp:Transcript_29927/g.89583  ORF Transcript_29927/g.89583 Transcript_29927/m.89583 type:complete len:226 (-) Transcript_29927:390-1067(-)